jgi:hypothetical protein
MSFGLFILTLLVKLCISMQIETGITCAILVQKVRRPLASSWTLLPVLLTWLHHLLDLNSSRNSSVVYLELVRSILLRAIVYLNWLIDVNFGVMLSAGKRNRITWTFISTGMCMPLLAILLIIPVGTVAEVIIEGIVILGLLNPLLVTRPHLILLKLQPPIIPQVLLFTLKGIVPILGLHTAVDLTLDRETHLHIPNLRLLILITLRGVLVLIGVGLLLIGDTIHLITINLNLLMIKGKVEDLFHLVPQVLIPVVVRMVLSLLLDPLNPLVVLTDLRIATTPSRMLVLLLALERLSTLCMMIV